jgi:hypothetical protein
MDCFASLAMTEWTALTLTYRPPTGVASRENREALCGSEATGDDKSA